MQEHRQENQGKTNWDTADAMSTELVQLPASSRLSPASTIHPLVEYRNALSQPKYWQPWTSGNSSAELLAEAKPHRSDKKQIITFLAVGILIGLILCGIPLTAMTTLYMLSRNSNAGTTNTVIISNNNSSSNTIVLPSQCTNYSVNADSTRNALYASCPGCYCDNSTIIPTGWYRFMPPAGTQLTTSPVSINYCGTNNTGSFSGSLPVSPGDVSSGTLCVNRLGSLCDSTYSGISIVATNCNGYYVFFLKPITACNARYCTI